MRLRRLCWAWLAVLLSVSAAAAQDWAREMFDHTSHDFGVVARGAKVEHVFTLENIYVEDVHIADVRSSCGCTVPEVDRRLLKTWEKAHVKAVIDTRRFMGRKDATITVRLDLPFPAEVQLHTHCYIRGDVVMQPGEVRFGTVVQGTGAQQQVSVSYAGRTDWKIERVETNNPHLQARVVESAESARALGQIKYDLLVTLKADAPAGYLRDELILVTNDYSAQSARIPVMVEAMVLPAVTVRPSPLLMPVLAVGQSATRQLVVQAATPFRITGVQCDDPRFAFKLPEGSRPLQLIPVSFTAQGTPGRVARTVKIATDLPDSPVVDVTVNVQVIEAPAAQLPPPATPGPQSEEAAPPVIPAIPQPRATTGPPDNPAGEPPPATSPDALGGTL